VNTKRKNDELIESKNGSKSVKSVWMVREIVICKALYPEILWLHFMLWQWWT